jgi:hypothetical protein
MAVARALSRQLSQHGAIRDVQHGYSQLARPMLQRRNALASQRRRRQRGYRALAEPAQPPSVWQPSGAL